ncbi:sensor histidine kinase [Microbacterium album]|uniref:histidine kinase n=1 Tax=Microbacterium album TaxID=2053191 RepID=A0A917IDY0_9MICO|nr:PAS domain-containing sensor histidine kinase [Microbacterium album]GGH39812.1 two-component sensor histidine kinase [Microbacterium album]
MASGIERATAPHAPPPGGRAPDSRARSIWVTQLAFAGSVVAIALVVQALMPGHITSWAFATGLAVVIGTTMAAVAVPWHRLPRHAVIALPLGDLVGIGFMGAGGDLQLGFLWVFPIVWLATHFPLTALIGALVLVVGIMLADTALTGGGDSSALRVIVTTLCLTFIGLTTHLSARQTRAFKRLLRRQTTRMQATIERVSAQERSVSLMLNAIDVGIVRLSPDGELIAMNDTYARLYGVDPENPAHPGRAVEYRSRRGEALPAPERPLARAARGEVFDDERVWLFDADGEWHALSVSARRVGCDGDEPPSVLLIVHDVTALIESERAHQRLSAVVSHELRNPLTAVVGHAELALDRGDLPDWARERFEHISRAGERMEVLVGQVLSGAGSRNTAQQPTPVDLRSVVENSLDSFRPAASAQGVSLHLVAPDPVPLVGDAFRLRQVVDNLVSNAIKYTPREGSVRVTCRRGDEGAELMLTDTGIGIGPEDLPRIFEPYFRAATAQESAAPGTGLGMGIARDIVAAHGGTVDVESETGRGTTVTVRLPVQAAVPTRG